MDTFGVNISKFQFLLARQFDASVINCKFSIDEDFSFICLMPHDAFIARLIGLAQMLLKRSKEKDRMMNFEVDQNPRYDSLLTNHKTYFSPQKFFHNLQTKKYQMQSTQYNQCND